MMSLTRWLASSLILAGLLHSEPIPQLQKVVADMLALDDHVASIHLETETTLWMADLKSGELHPLSQHGNLKAWFDGLAPSKYRLAYTPFVMPYVGSAASAVTGDKLLVSDGKTCWSLVESSDAAMQSRRRGEISGFPPPKSTKFDSLHTGIAFLLPSAALGGTTFGEFFSNPTTPEQRLSLREDGDGLWTCDIDPAYSFPRADSVSTEKGTYKKLVTDRRVSIWIDSHHAFALARLENWRVNVNTGERIQLLTRYSVSAFEPVLNGKLYFPREMKFERYVKGQLFQRSDISLKSIVFNERAPEGTFHLAFPPGTKVMDDRLNLSFVVGKEPSQVVRESISAVEEERRQ